VPDPTVRRPQGDNRRFLTRNADLREVSGMRTTSKHRPLVPGARVQLNSLLTRSGRFSHGALIERPLIRTANPNLSRPLRKGAEDNQSRSSHPNGCVPGRRPRHGIETSLMGFRSRGAYPMAPRAIGRSVRVGRPLPQASPEAICFQAPSGSLNLSVASYVLHTHICQ
jgi:hypothetical protein